MKSRKRSKSRRRLQENSLSQQPAIVVTSNLVDLLPLLRTRRTVGYCIHGYHRRVRKQTPLL